MNPTPRVSVVMAFHRDQPFLRPAIESVRAQTFPDWELILVDNGTGLPAEELGDAGRDPRLRWIRFDRNVGIPKAQNAAVSQARGEFIALLDHDDLMRPSRLERQIGALQADPSLGLVSSLVRRIDESNTVVGGEFSLVEPAEQFAYTAYAAPVVTPAYTGRREWFTRFPFREAFSWASDLDFLARCAEVTKLAAVPEVLLHYRWHGAQTTQRRRAEIERDLTVIRLLTARRRAGRDESFDSMRGWLEGDAPAPSESCWRTGQRALEEKFPVLAAYHARRMIVLRRSLGTLIRGFSLARRAGKQAGPGEGAAVSAMFRHGAVKALGLHPDWSEARRAPASGLAGAE